MTLADNKVQAQTTMGTGLTLLALIAIAGLYGTNARPLPGYVVSGLSLLIFAGVALTRSQDLTGLARDHALLAYVAYVVTALLVSLAFSEQDPRGLALQSLVLLGYGAIYAAASSLCGTCKVHLLWGLAFLIGGIAVYGLAAHQVPELYVQNKLYNHHAVTGTFINPNHFATLLGFGLVLALSLALTQVKTDTKPFILGLICLYALLQTGSRAGLAASAIGLTCTVLAHRMTRSSASVGNGRLWIYTAAALAIVLLASLGSVTVERLARLLAEAPIRIVLYADVLQTIAAAPLTGYGLGSFEEVYRTLQSPSVNINRTWLSAHSAPLETLFETGAIVFLIPLASTFLFVGNLLRTLRRSTTGPRLAALGIIATGLGHSLFDNTLSIPAIGAVFATALGAARPAGSVA